MPERRTYPRRRERENAADGRGARRRAPVEIEVQDFPWRTAQALVPGTIAVSVEPLPQDHLRVRISDDGKGLPAAPRAAAPGSGTGMRIIEGLARQIGAKPVWSSSGGTALCLEFASSQGRGAAAG